MALDPKQLLKPVRKLERAIKKLAKMPAPEEVHKLRTRSRQLEAEIHALRFDRTRRGQHLLKSVKPIRKGAGKVRDMDVLTALAATVQCGSQEDGSGPDEPVVTLLELLGKRRHRSAKLFHKVVSAGRNKVLRELKQFHSHLEKQMKQLQHAKPSAGPTDPAAVAASLAGELAAWPKIHRETLHPYRLKVKELRSILQLAEEPDARLIEALGEAKDRIGTWHDWCELETVARQMHGSDATLVRRIHALAEQELQRALKAANDLQRQHFARRSGGGGSKPVRVKEPILISAARLSA